jgi:hypothetical protein
MYPKLRSKVSFKENANFVEISHSAPLIQTTELSELEDQVRFAFVARALGSRHVHLGGVLARRECDLPPDGGLSLRIGFLPACPRFERQSEWGDCVFYSVGAAVLAVLRAFALSRDRALRLAVRVLAGWAGGFFGVYLLTASGASVTGGVTRLLCRVIDPPARLTR